MLKPKLSAKLSTKSKAMRIPILPYLLPVMPCDAGAALMRLYAQHRAIRAMANRARAPSAGLAAFLTVLALNAAPAHAVYRITNDRGGYVEEYKQRYAKLRDRGERVVIDGVCNSACTLVLGIIPANRICVTPRASLGFHQAYYDKSFTFGIKFTSNAGTDELMAYYPVSVKNWIAKQGGLTPDMKKVRNGMDLWKIADPCPEEF